MEAFLWATTASLRQYIDSAVERYDDPRARRSFDEINFPSGPARVKDGARSPALGALSAPYRLLRSRSVRLSRDGGFDDRWWDNPSLELDPEARRAFFEASARCGQRWFLEWDIKISGAMGIGSFESRTRHRLSHSDLIANSFAIELSILAMPDHLASLRLFARVARKASFSAAARELGIPLSTVSRTIADLEREIGVGLLMRSTRAVTLTDAGADFLGRLEPILADLEDAEQIVRGDDELRGVLRVGLGSSLAVREVIPRLPIFMDKHKALHVDLILEDQRRDLVAEGVDVALRFGPLPDSMATVQRICVWPHVLVAAPDYLAKAGVPQTPTELSAHNLIIGPLSPGTNLSFRKGSTAISVRAKGRVRVAGDEGAIAAAVAGLGLVVTSSGSCRRETASGALVRVLTEWDLGSSDLSAVFVIGRVAKHASRVFTDYLIATLRDT
jgi:DNA-binding transcriptional LysR family regulator